MNKNILAAAIFASLSALVMPAHAADIDPATQLIIDAALTNDCQVDIADTKDFDITDSKDCDFNAALATAIAENSALAESLVAAAIEVVGVDSAQIPSILQTATDAGLNSDTVTGIAIAGGVDATIASGATAAGNTNNVTRRNNTVTTTNRGGGNGGGGGGISPNQ